jgi:hypothetical protein
MSKLYMEAAALAVQAYAKAEAEREYVTLAKVITCVAKPRVGCSTLGFPSHVPLPPLSLSSSFHSSTGTDNWKELALRHTTLVARTRRWLT